MPLNNPSIGSMYYKIVIQKFTVDKKSNGEEMPLWVDYVTTMAEMITTSANENEINDKLTAVDDVEFIIRITTTITEKMRIVYNNVVYEIKGIIPIKRRFQKIKAEKNTTWTDEYLVQTDVTADYTGVTADKQNK